MDILLKTNRTLWRNTKNTVKKADLLLETFFFVLFFLCVLFSHSKQTLYISFVGMIAYFVNLFLSDNVFLWKYVAMAFSHAYYLLGVFVCELSPVYLSELNVTTHYTGAFQSLALYNWLFFSTLRIADQYITRYMKRHKVRIRFKRANLSKLVFRFGVIIIFLLGTAMLLPIINKPAFKYGVTRFRYMRDYMPHILSRLASFPTCLCPLILCPLIQNQKISMKRRIRTILLAYLPYLVFLIWSGNKFGKIWTVFYCIAIPLMFAYGNSRIRIKGFLLPIGLGIILTGSVLGYHMMRGLSFIDAVGKLVWRTSAQGELWWGVFNLKTGQGLRIEECLDELRAIIQTIITRGAVRQQGVYRLMGMLGDPETVRNYLNVSVRFSAGGFELPFYYFKYWSFLFLPLLVCPVYAMITNCYISAVLSGEFVTAIASLQVLITFKGIVGQGDWFNLVSYDTLLFLFVLIFTSLLHAAFYNKEIEH